MQVVTGK